VGSPGGKESGMNGDKIPWTDPEKDVVDNFMGDHVDVWEEYRARFGFNGRSFESIKRRWYRVHERVEV
jgi:hypothetical protein